MMTDVGCPAYVGTCKVRHGTIHDTKHRDEGPYVKLYAAELTQRKARRDMKEREQCSIKRALVR